MFGLGILPIDDYIPNLLYDIYHLCLDSFCSFHGRNGCVIPSHSCSKVVPFLVGGTSRRHDSKRRSQISLLLFSFHSSLGRRFHHFGGWKLLLLMVLVAGRNFSSAERKSTQLGFQQLVVGIDPSLSQLLIRNIDMKPEVYDKKHRHEITIR